MPVIPPSSSLQYDAVGYALNDARVNLGDRLDTLQFNTGKIMDFTDSFMNQVTNRAWRKLQAYLGNLGYQQVTSEVLIMSLPVVQTVDPAVFTWLGWTGYFDGANLNPTPALPSDFTYPIKVWERWSGQNMQFSDPSMEKILDGMPTRSKTTSNRFWEWRSDAIWMPGSQMIEDLRIRYVRWLADFADLGTTRWYQQTVPIMRCSDALGWFIAAAVENAAKNGDKDVAAGFLTNGMAAADEIFNRDVRADQRVNIQRRPRSSRSAYGSY